jgi:hypothetical protein
MKKNKIKRSGVVAILEAWKQAGQDETVIVSEDNFEERYFHYPRLSFRKNFLPLRKLRRRYRL